MSLQTQLLAAAGINQEQKDAMMTGMKATFNLLCEVRSAVVFAFGRNSSKLIEPHDRASLPFIRTADVTNVLALDIKSTLNKSVTRGHIKNLGENAVLLRFQSVGNSAMSQQYELASGDVLDYSSWSFDALEVRATAAGASRVCILAQ